ncbi:MAG TPA: DUF3551 domain-containing protein [Xanthobacteraceae bacterium]|nr:DUF3551 domain-containing protein [Xanthobacteraceae bacterium]
MQFNVSIQFLAKTAVAAAIFTVLLALFLCFDVSASHASQYGHAPWCAVENDGGRLVWDCEYLSAQECSASVIAGNRGFCSRNPYWEHNPYRRGG